MPSLARASAPLSRLSTRCPPRRVNLLAVSDGRDAPPRRRHSRIASPQPTASYNGSLSAKPNNSAGRPVCPLVAAKAALAELDDLEQEEWTREDTIERLRAAYQYRKRRFAAQAGRIEDDGYEDRSLAYQQVVQLVLAAQREALVRSRNSGEISNETMNHVIRDLDLEESRLEI